MPELSGLETNPKLCQQGFDAPIILMSGYHETDDSEKNLVYLNKPFTRQQLLGV
jgi:FixJ family two-component response regulator